MVASRTLDVHAPGDRTRPPPRPHPRRPCGGRAPAPPRPRHHRGSTARASTAPRRIEVPASRRRTSAASSRKMAAGASIAQRGASVASGSNTVKDASANLRSEGTRLAAAVVEHARGRMAPHAARHDIVEACLGIVAARRGEEQIDAAQLRESAVVDRGAQKLVEIHSIGAAHRQESAPDDVHLRLFAEGRKGPANVDELQAVRRDAEVLRVHVGVAPAGRAEPTDQGAARQARARRYRARSPPNPSR